MIDRQLSTSSQSASLLGAFAVLALVMFGLVIGLAAGGAASRVLTTLLYGYRPDYFSPAAVVSIILIVVAALACLVPARRASRTDPMIARGSRSAQIESSSFRPRSLMHRG